MNAFAQRVVGVEHGVAGFAQVDEAALKSKLGHTAWVVWQILCSRRNRRGVTHTTLAGVARAGGFENFHIRAVVRAMRRLEKACLVERVGFASLQIANGSSVKVFLRRIRGAIQLGIVGEVKVSVPQETKDWVRGAARRGGARPGAGRPPITARAVNSKPDRIHCTASEIKPDRMNSKPDRTHGTYSEIKPDHRLSTLTKGRDVGGCEDSPYGESKPSPGAAPATPLVELEKAGVGTVLGGRATRTPPMLSTPIQGLPPYPGISLVAPAEVPPPPKLKASDPEHVHVRMLATAFRAAVEREYGKPCWLLANISPKSKHYKTLARAASQLAQYDTAPIAWCAYAVRRWYLARTHTGGWEKGMPVPLPPVSVVFSARALDERLGEEESRGVVASSARGGTLIFGRTHKSLIARFGEMRRALRSGLSPQQAREKFFPGSRFEEMVDAAKCEAMEIRARLENEIARGKMVW